MKFSAIYLILLSFQIVNCGSEPQILYLDRTYQITQNQTAENFQINLFSIDPRFNYLIIQIDVISALYPVYKLVACLNFNQTTVEQQSQQYSELNTCQFSDTLATQEQLKQHLLIINNNNSDYSTRTPMFLTILYTQKFNDNTIQNLQQLHQIQYNVKVYQDYLQPCHKNCNQQGYCDNQLGKCTCESQFFGIDCSIQLNALNISETQNITISSMEQSFFILKFENVQTNSNGKSTQICLQKLNGTAIIYFQIIFNKLELPSIFNNNIQQTIQTNEIITIQSLEQKCNEHQRDQSLSNSYQLNSCFAVISIQQSVSDEPTILSISAQYSQQTMSQQNSSSEQSKQYQIAQTKIIIIVVTLSAFLLCIFIFVLVKIRKRRASTQNRNNQNLQRSNNENFQINIDVTKAKILFLQEAFMPIVQYDSFKKQNELNIIQIRQDNQKIQKEQNQNEQNFTEDRFVIKDRIEGDQQQDIGKDHQNQDKNSKEQNTKEDIQAEKDNANNCSICLVEIVAQDELRLTICSHLFHSNCLISWISQNDSCPLCRQSFAIIDIIDYLIAKKTNQNATKEQVVEIQSQKDKILELLQTEKNKQLTLSDFELLNIFKYFLPFETLQKYQLTQKQSNQQCNNEAENKDKEQMLVSAQIQRRKKCSIQIENTAFDNSPTSMLMSNPLNQQFRSNLETANQTERLIQERRVSIFH